MPLNIEDRLAIQELVARYNHAVDFGDQQAWLALFTDDGVFEGGPEPRYEMRGREQLAQFASRFQGDRGSRHWTNNSIIEGDGDEVTHIMYLAVLRTGDPPGIRLTGVYRDRIVRQNGQWKFKSRSVEFAPVAVRA